MDQVKFLSADMLMQKYREQANQAALKNKPVRVGLRDYTIMVTSLGHMFRGQFWVGPHGGMVFYGAEFLPKGK